MWKNGGAGWCGRGGRQVGVEEWGGRLVWKRGEAGRCGRMGGQVGVEEGGSR